MHVGGTVEEVKQRMSYGEAVKWFEYRHKYGGLPQQRTARLLGNLACMFNNANGGKAEIHDFLPELTPAPIDNADDLWNALFPDR